VDARGWFSDESSILGGGMRPPSSAGAASCEEKDGRSGREVGGEVDRCFGEREPRRTSRVRGGVGRLQHRGKVAQSIESVRALIAWS
jgi:hypothetical protein